MMARAITPALELGAVAGSSSPVARGGLVNARCLAPLIAAWLVLVASATAADRWARVVEDSLLRVRPGRWSRVVGKVHAGDRVLVQEDDGRRARVRRGELSGWLRADRIETWPTAAAPRSGADASMEAVAAADLAVAEAGLGSPAPIDRPAPVRPDAAPAELAAGRPDDVSSRPDANRAPPLPATNLLRLSDPRELLPAVRIEAGVPRVLLLRTRADLGSPSSGTCRPGERLTLSAGDRSNGFTHLRCASGASGWAVSAALVPTTWMARR